MENYETMLREALFSNKQYDAGTLEKAFRALDSQVDFSVQVVGSERVIHVSNETGEGSMRLVDVMPGVALAFNDFNMAYCSSGFSSNGKHLSVHYCKSGRMEQALPGGSFAYTSQGDFKIADFEQHAGIYVFPTGHYQGISLGFDIDVCQDALAAVFGGFSIDVTALREKFCRRNVPYVLHGFAEGERIFGALYNVEPQKIRTYAQAAALNTLVILDQLEYCSDNQELEYFHQAQVEKVKRAHALMTSDIMRSYTVEQLADQVDLPVTTFKTCFKGVFGKPPYSYLRAYRMDRAAEMLRNTNRSVADIGASVGYESPSKFTAAFKSVMGVTPSSYRHTPWNPNGRLRVCMESGRDRATSEWTQSNNRHKSCL